MVFIYSLRYLQLKAYLVRENKLTKKSKCNIIKLAIISYERRSYFSALCNCA